MDENQFNQNMTPQMRRYFANIERTFGLKLYFYGSIKRYDYFPNESDIDIDIFAENPDSLKFQLKQYFRLKTKKIKNVMTYINGIPIHGYKFSHLNQKLQIKCEFSVYPSQYKKLILQEHLKKTRLPFIGTFCLLIVKTMYYSLNLLDLNTYKQLKKYILSTVVGYKDPPFVIFNHFKNLS